jgi:hypothetical protein
MSNARRRSAGATTKPSTRGRRARPLWLVAGIALTLALTTAFSITSFDGASLANAAVERAKSFLQIIQQRSPGARTKAQLALTKQKRPILHERALPKVRMALPAIPPPTLEPALIDIVAPPVPVVPASFEAMTVPPLQSLSPPGIPIILPPGLIVPPTERPSTPPIVTPPSAVPEPATWMTMLLGFGLIGWQLRRRRPEQKQLSVS